jgi:hypothetical protein
MPLQNRVTPFGDIVPISQRGMFTGNRGIIHDPETRTLLTRRWAGQAWLICRCDFQGRRREVMRKRNWTELFFLDEAIALAAGHRPCILCRRKEAEMFRSAWTAGNRADRPAAALIDVTLHRERIRGRGVGSSIKSAVAAELPDGVVIAAGSSAFTVVGGRGFRWTESEYEPGAELPSITYILTPPRRWRPSWPDIDL